MVRMKTRVSPARPAAVTTASVLPFRYVGLAVAGGSSVGVRVVGDGMEAVIFFFLGVWFDRHKPLCLHQM